MSRIAGAAPAVVGREEGQRLARDELSDPVYQAAEPSLIERLWMRFGEWLDELTSRVGAEVPGGWVLGAVLLVLAVLAVAGLVYLAPSRRARRRGAVLDAGPVHTARDHRSRAEDRAAAGDFAQAIRERLRAIGRELEERAVIAPRPGRTATELAFEAAEALPGHRTTLEEAARVFNDVWYGERPATAEGYRILVAADDALRSSTLVPEPSA